MQVVQIHKKKYLYKIYFITFISRYISLREQDASHKLISDVSCLISTEMKKQTRTRLVRNIITESQFPTTYICRLDKKKNTYIYTKCSVNNGMTETILIVLCRFIKIWYILYIKRKKHFQREYKIFIINKLLITNCRWLYEIRGCNGYKINRTLKVRIRQTTIVWIGHAWRKINNKKEWWLANNHSGKRSGERH